MGRDDAARHNELAAPAGSFRLGFEPYRQLVDVSRRQRLRGAQPTTPFAGCSGLPGASGSDSATALDDLQRIPSADMYGNSTDGTGYQQSQVLDSNGNIVSPKPCL